jgi:hypothetical protein
MGKVKTQRGPSALGIFVAALFMLLAGFLAGVVYLASFQPVRFAGPYEYERALEKENGGPAGPRAHCYYAPPPLGVRTWQAKRDRLLEARNTSVTFSLSELNAWWGSEFGSMRFEEEESAKISLRPGVPYFAVGRDGLLHISSPLDVNAFGRQFELMLTVRGAFENEGGGVRFRVVKMLFNSAPVPGAEAFSARLFPKVGGEAFAAEEFDPYRELLARLDRVELGEASIRFVVR